MGRAQRLSVVETSLLLFDRPEAPFAFLACIELDGSPLLDEQGHARLDLVQEMAPATVEANPRLRQVPRWVPLGLGRPVWEDAADFDVHEHFTAETLPEPTPAALHERLVSLMHAPFEADRPLWQNVLVDGLADGRVALLVKVHHCMMDGVGGLATFGSMLSLDGSVPSPPPLPPWEPQAPATPWRLAVDALRDHVLFARDLLRMALRALRRPRASWRRVRRMVANLRQDAFAKSPGIGLMEPPGPRRAIMLETLSMADVDTARSAFGATVTDVLISVAAGATWRLVQRREGSPLGARLAVRSLISGRTSDHAGLENHFASMTLLLTLGELDPVERLREICDVTRSAKTRNPAQDLQLLTDLLGFAVPGLLRRQLPRAERIGTPISVSSVPGAPVPVWFMGARILAMYGIPPLPLFGGIPMVCISNDGILGIGMTADPDVVPDLDVFTAALHEELRVLVEAAGRPGRRPGNTRSF